ncbi:unnamed protein product [Caenorhabditis auriculariae]|uniref:WH1 domain-containing protein n=1 Tax=Caenorhabditis auriculariae TaxID=2777116 RepID=A0A8S1GU35_9PELO|nr:unnamed protein product [Caenorhabditis auriculariae]
MSERCVAAAYAEVMIYNEAAKKWQPPGGSDGQVNKVEIMSSLHKTAFRIVSLRERDGACILNCNIYNRLKYHPATSTFHQWRDEHRQVYGLNFSSEVDARNFLSAMGQAVDQLNHQPPTEYHSINSDNVYQDPHQHLSHIHSAPAFGEHHENENHVANVNASFRKSSQPVTSMNSVLGMSQQQRRASQASNSSGSAIASNSHAYSQEQSDSRGYWQSSAAPAAPVAAQNAPPPAPVPPSSAVPPAPPLPPLNSGAPPPPPPPPPNFAAASTAKGTSLADQLKMKSAALNKTVGPKETRSPAEQSTAAPPPAPASGNLMSELAATINKRKMTQAKADAVDSKSNTSNASTDSGCGIPPVNGGLTNGNVKKVADVKLNGSDSPKTHRKAPSGSSIFSQDEAKAANVAELLERFKADLMVEVRLEINKAKHDIIEALRSELSRR